MIVTIKNKIPLFKSGEKASNIELLELEEYGFNIVSQIDLYQIGDKAVYIEPDMNLPDNQLFESFIRPNGDAKKSRLGSNNRVRAIKFNFTKENSSDIVYSNGILLSAHDVCDFIAFTNNASYGMTMDNLHYFPEDIYKQLGVTKYEAFEDSSKGGLKNGQSGEFPKGWYRTDETNFMKICNSITFPQIFVGTEKCDGSSISISSNYICSRNQSKPPIYQKVVGTRALTWWEKLIKFFNKSYRPDVAIKEHVMSDSDFVKYGLKYYNLLAEKSLDDIVLRGELNGGHLKGSGNKNNPAAKEQPNIKFYGVDILKNGITVKADYLTFRKVVENLELPTVKEVFNRQFESKEDLLQTCQEYFKTNLIEGIVCRSLDSTISFKVINDEYDSKK